MPFNAAGIAPDLIMNPHGFPSRMTVGKLMELLAGKSACMDGHIKDSTVFAGDDIETIADVSRVLELEWSDALNLIYRF